MKIENDWKDIGFGAYILYLENDYNVYISTGSIQYFSCILNKFSDAIVYFDIYSQDKKIKHRIMKNVMTVLKKSKNIKEVASIFFNIYGMRINNDITYNFLGGVGYVV